jgi:hypothetical protein
MVRLIAKSTLQRLAGAIGYRLTGVRLPSNPAQVTVYEHGS